MLIKNKYKTAAPLYGADMLHQLMAQQFYTDLAPLSYRKGLKSDFLIFNIQGFFKEALCNQVLFKPVRTLHS